MSTISCGSRGGKFQHPDRASSSPPAAPGLNSMPSTCQGVCRPRAMPKSCSLFMDVVLVSGSLPTEFGPDTVLAATALPTRFHIEPKFAALPSRTVPVFAPLLAPPSFFSVKSYFELAMSGNGIGARMEVTDSGSREAPQPPHMIWQPNIISKR